MKARRFTTAAPSCSFSTAPAAKRLYPRNASSAPKSGSRGAVRRPYAIACWRHCIEHRFRPEVQDNSTPGSRAPSNGTKLENSRRASISNEDQTCPRKSTKGPSMKRGQLEQLATTDFEYTGPAVSRASGTRGAPKTYNAGAQNSPRISRNLKRCDPAAF